MSAGVASTPKTQIDCPRLKNFVEAGIAPDCQPIGDGCNPAHIATIANQLEAKRLTWGALSVTFTLRDITAAQKRINDQRLGFSV
jgi:hypothetical protein